MKFTEIEEASTDPKLVGKQQAVANLKANRQRLPATTPAATTTPTTPATPTADTAPPEATNTAQAATGATTQTITTPGSTRPVEKPGLMYRMGKGLVGAAAALGSTTAQKAHKQATDLEKARNFRAGPTTTTTTTPGTAPPAPVDGEKPAPTTPAPETPVAPSPGKNPLFKDPAVFKAEWDKYVASKGGEKYRLISDPEMLMLFKNIWMRTGGTKVETKLPINFKKKLTESVLMEDPTDTAAPTVGADTAAPTAPVAPSAGAGSFGDYKKLRADFEAFQEADGAMAPQVRGVLKDILLTALRTVESQQRKLAQMSRIIRESKQLKRKLAVTKQRAAQA